MNGPLVVLATILSTLWLGPQTGTPPPEQKPPAQGAETGGDTKTPPPAQDTETNGDTKTPPAPPIGPTAGQGAPVVVLRPTQTAYLVTVAVPLDPGQKVPERDFRAGLLVSTANADLKIVPEIKVGARPNHESPTLADLTVSGLAPFGEFAVPVLHRLRQADTLRFHKPGLLVVGPAGSEIVALQKRQHLELVLENPTIHDYAGVAARVRFQGIEECDARADQVSAQTVSPGEDEPWWFERLGTWSKGWGTWVWAGFEREGASDGCLDSKWARFDVRGSSRVTLHIPLHDAWFEDLESGLTRSASRAGMLTLRYPPPAAQQGTDPAAAEGVAEQNVPLTVRFEGRSGSLFLSMLWVFFLLAIGAFIFLVLRVSIPNYRRKKDLKEQLKTLLTAADNVSDQVDSQLRVLVRVERMALDQSRKAATVFVPGFADLASRIESGIATLRRKIALVERLDAATCRRENLVLGPVAPTRLDIIDRSLDAACEVLKLDQLGEADWLFVQQKLEAADKALNEPSPEEKQAFEALLSTRWKSVRDHFTPAQGSRQLTPKGLEVFKPCFPDGELLPEADDPDGMGWIKSVGVVHGDLQVTALELLREAHFRAHALSREKWQKEGAADRLTVWLASPAIATLGQARGLLRQVAEDVCPKDVEEALIRKKAFIDQDPQCISPNQTVGFTLRFRDPILNRAAALAAIRCEWEFQDPTFGTPQEPSWLARRVRALKRWTGIGTNDKEPEPGNQPPKDGTSVQVPVLERGWQVHRYFEPTVASQRICVRFFHDGDPISVADPDTAYSREIVLQTQEHANADNERVRRFAFQILQMLAVLLVPLVTLAMTTAGEPSSGQWWDLIGLGFGSEAIRNIVTGDQK